MNDPSLVREMNRLARAEQPPEAFLQGILALERERRFWCTRSGGDVVRHRHPFQELHRDRGRSALRLLEAV